MFAMGMTRQRQAEREKRVHRAAIHRALVRQLEREQIKQGFENNFEDSGHKKLSDDEEGRDDPTSTITTETTFFDLCDETIVKKKQNKGVRSKGKQQEKLKVKINKTGTSSMFATHN